MKKQYKNAKDIGIKIKMIYTSWEIIIEMGDFMYLVFDIGVTFMKYGLTNGKRNIYTKNKISSEIAI